MSRLSDLVQRCYDQLDHNPTLRAYRDRVVDVMSSTYQRVSAEDQWRFLQTEANLAIWATVTGSTTATVTIGVGAGNRRLVTGVGTAFAEHYEGHVFRGPDGEDYTIGRVASATVLYLADPYAGGSVTTDDDWSIRFHRYVLPADCEDLLSLVDRANDRGPLAFIDRRREAYDYLDEDTTGDPIVAIDDDWVRLRAPDSAPTLAGNTTGGSELVVGVVYAYCYTFLHQGRESAPSPVAEHTIATGETEVDISAVEDTTWQDTVTFTGLATGKRKALYRRDATNQGRWIRIAVLGDSATTFTDDTLLPDIAEDWDHVVELRDQQMRPSIRLWYTPDTDTSLSLRYHRRPRQLYAAADEPEWPHAYHEVLVFGTMFDLLSQYGDPAQAATWEKRAEKRLKSMRNRYLVAPAQHHVRRSWSRYLLDDMRQRNGIPSRAT